MTPKVKLRFRRAVIDLIGWLIIFGFFAFGISVMS